MAILQPELKPEMFPFVKGNQGSNDKIQKATALQQLRLQAAVSQYIRSAVSSTTCFWID